MLGNIFAKQEANMSKNIPQVSRAILTDPQKAGPGIQLDTPAWFAWLEAPSTSATQPVASMP